MTYLALIADRALNRPLLITPDKAQVILSVLSGRIGIDGPEASRFVGTSVDRDEDGRTVKRMPYKRTDNGVAIISIVGTLVNRGAYIGASSGLVSYEGIKHQLAEVLKDSSVHTVVLDINSPGGEATGAFEVGDAVRALAKEKKVVAIVNGMAASAAYAIASGASEIVTTSSGVSGSIGVVLVHADYSRQLDMDGVDPTLIYAGSHKVDGNPFEPLPDTVRTDLQQEVDAFYTLFLENVAAGRPKLGADGARKTEARTFIGKAAVKAGLADRVGTFEDVLAEISSARGGRTHSQQRGISMSENKGTPAETEKGISQADHDTAVAKAIADTQSTAVVAERARIQTILTSEETDGREKMAQHLAFETSMPADDAVAMLATAPKSASEENTTVDDYANERATSAGQAAPVKVRTTSSIVETAKQMNERS